MRGTQRFIGTCSRYGCNGGLGFWDGYSDDSDLMYMDMGASDFIDMGDFDVPMSDIGLDFENPMVTSFESEMFSGEIIDQEPEYEYANVEQPHTEYPIGPNYSPFTASGAHTDGPIGPNTTSTTRAPSGGPEASILSEILRIGPSAIDAATRLMRTQQQIELAKTALNRGTIPVGYTLNAQGQLVPAGGVVATVTDYIKKNPVPFFFAAAGLAIALTRKGK